MTDGGDRFTVRTFKRDEWQIYRSIRLEALKDAPNAFATTYEESASRDDVEWRDRLEITTSTDLPLAVFDDQRAVGLCWVTLSDADPRTSHLFQMWVAPDVRGLGLSRRLLIRAIDWAREVKAERMVLGVTQGDTPARRLYASMGFVPIGSEPLREGSPLRVDNMTLDLAATEVD